MNLQEVCQRIQNQRRMSPSPRIQSTNSKLLKRPIMSIPICRMPFRTRIPAKKSLWTQNRRRLELWAVSIFLSYLKLRVNSSSFPGSLLDNEVILLPDPRTGLYPDDEIICIYGSRPVPGGGKQYRVCVRDRDKDEAVFWAHQAVKSRPDFQRFHNPKGQLYRFFPFLYIR